MRSGSLYLRHNLAGLKFHQMIQVNNRVRLVDQTQFHIDFSLFYVCFMYQIRFEKQDLEKIASTNSIFSLRTVTTSLQYVGFLVTQHIDMRPNFLRKKHCIEVANQFSVPKSIINSKRHLPSFLMACK